MHKSLRSRFFLSGLALVTTMHTAGCVVKPLLIETQTATDPLAGIVVLGRGKLEVKPDQATVIFDIRAREEQPEAAMNAVEQKAVKVLATVENLGIAKDSISTDQLYLSSEFDSDLPHYEIRERMSVPGYKPPKKLYAGVYRVKVKLHDLSKVAPLLMAVVHDGVDDIKEVRFTAKNVAPSYAQARELAVQDAFTKARDLARHAGRELGEAKSVTTVWGHHEPREQRELSERIEYGSKGAMMPVLPGYLKIESSVRVQFELLEPGSASETPQTDSQV